MLHLTCPYYNFIVIYTPSLAHLNALYIHLNTFSKGKSVTNIEHLQHLKLLRMSRVLKNFSYEIVRILNSSQSPLLPSQRFYFEKWWHKHRTFTRTLSWYELFRCNLSHETLITS